MAPKAGNVLLDGKSIHKQSTREVAKQLAILPQNPTAPEGLTVTELVSYGRFPYQKGFGSMRSEDKRMIEWAIEVTAMTELVDRPIDQLSGGQRQRAWIAMALAQETDILFLDEPTTFLDMAHQLEVLQLLEQLNATANRTIVMVVHDLNHASRYAHHMIGIKKGKAIAHGSPVEVMNTDVLREVFNIEADIVTDPRSGVPLCLPYALAGERQQSKTPDQMVMNSAMVHAGGTTSRNLLVKRQEVNEMGHAWSLHYRMKPLCIMHAAHSHSWEVCNQWEQSTTTG